jgi:hypothetical protein
VPQIGQHALDSFERAVILGRLETLFDLSMKCEQFVAR